jgi:3-hydroxy-D-aspartate aldolase
MFLAAAAAAPHLATRAEAARWTHIEERVSRRNFEGLTREDLPTPCLILDLAAFERNVKKITDHSKATGIQLRLHVKIHKSPEVSKRQAAMGAQGVCCATIAESELMVNAGLPNVLYTCQPAGREKISRAVALAKRAPTFTCVVDDIRVAREIEQAAAAEKIKLNLLVDVFAGLQRQGCEPGETALKIAQFIDKSQHLKLVGLMAYSGAASHTKTFAARKKRSEEDLAGMLQTAEMCQKSGLSIPIKSGGSTGTYNIDVGLLTELQAGKFVFMDTGYRKIGGKSNDEVYEDFEHALTVLTTVTSATRPNMAAIDMGRKATVQPTDQVKGHPDLKVDVQGAEYGMLRWEGGDSRFAPGARVELYPTDLDSTTNAYDRYYIARGDKIVDAWPIMGRSGAAQR